MAASLAAALLLARPSLVESAAVMEALLELLDAVAMSGCFGAPNMSPRSALGCSSWGCERRKEEISNKGEEKLMKFCGMHKTQFSNLKCTTVADTPGTLYLRNYLVC